MATLFPKLHTYKTVSGEWVRGEWVSSQQSATFRGSIQPTVGKDTDFLPQARRDKGAVKLYSDTPLNVSQEGAAHSGDIVSWQGRDYEVVTALPYQNGLIPHYKYLASDVGTTP